MDPIETLFFSLHKQFREILGNDIFFLYAAWILEICDRVLESPKSSDFISDNTRQIFSYANDWLNGKMSYDDFCSNCYSMREAIHIEETLHLVIYNLIDFIDGDDFLVSSVDESAYQLFNCEKKMMEFLYEEPEHSKTLRLDNVMRLIEMSQTFS